MNLRDRYDDAGFLRQGAIRYEVDEVVIAEPWLASVNDIGNVLGTGSPSRRGLATHLRGFVSWFDEAFRTDPEREIWLRGPFASSLLPEVEHLDVVVHYDSRQTSRARSGSSAFLPLNRFPYTPDDSLSQPCAIMTPTATNRNVTERLAGAASVSWTRRRTRRS